MAIIFYSWQSDNSNARNRIGTAIKKAITSLAIELKEAERQDELELDQDTKGIAGSVDIIQTIFSKIDNADIFIADVTPIYRGNGKLAPNPNVMTELGYAIKALGYNRCIFVCQTNPADKGLVMPFDISGKKLMYLPPTLGPTQLAGEIKDAISLCLTHVIKIKQNTEEAEKRTASQADKHALLEGVKARQPTRSLAEKYFSDLYQRYLELAPHRYRPSTDNIESYRALVYEAYVNTLPLTEEAFEVINLIAEYNDEKAIFSMVKQLERLTKYLDILPEDGPQLSEISKEYFGFILYELISLIIGALAREKRWDLIAQIKNIRFNRSPIVGGYKTIEDTYYQPEHALNYYQELKSQNYIIPTTPLLRERFEARDDMLKQYVSGSIFMYLTSDFYFPWPVGLLFGDSYSQYIPEYIFELKSKDLCNEIRKSSNLTTIDEFRDAIWNRATRGMGFWRSSLEQVFKDAQINSANDIASV